MTCWSNSESSWVGVRHAHSSMTRKIWEISTRESLLWVTGNCLCQLETPLESKEVLSSLEGTFHKVHLCILPPKLYTKQLLLISTEIHFDFPSKSSRVFSSFPPRHTTREGFLPEIGRRPNVPASGSRPPTPPEVSSVGSLDIWAILICAKRITLSNLSFQNEP